jgi:hypothetical protein
MNNIAIFNSENTRVINYSDNKGRALSISAEGAIHKGGKTLMSLMKDAATESAFNKAANGKYRAAADILTVGFPSIGKSAEKLLGTVWANKTNMATIIHAVLRAEPGEKGFNTKQINARGLASELLTLPAFAVKAEEGEVIDA